MSSSVDARSRGAPDPRAGLRGAEAAFGLCARSSRNVQGSSSAPCASANRSYSCDERGTHSVRHTSSSTAPLAALDLAEAVIVNAQPEHVPMICREVIAQLTSAGLPARAVPLTRLRSHLGPRGTPDLRGFPRRTTQ